jgi:hypothetical protein
MYEHGQALSTVYVCMECTVIKNVFHCYCATGISLNMCAKFAPILIINKI